MSRKVDPVTLSVVQGTLRSNTKEMTVTMERTCRSPILTMAHDYSNTICEALSKALPERATGGFNHGPGLIFYGRDPRRKEPYVYLCIEHILGGVGPEPTRWTAGIARGLLAPAGRLPARTWSSWNTTSPSTSTATR